MEQMDEALGEGRLLGDQISLPPLAISVTGFFHID